MTNKEAATYLAAYQMLMIPETPQTDEIEAVLQRFKDTGTKRRYDIITEMYEKQLSRAFDVLYTYLCNRNCIHGCSLGEFLDQEEEAQKIPKWNRPICGDDPEDPGEPEEDEEEEEEKSDLEDLTAALNAL
jgi:hypothetical protein